MSEFPKCQEMRFPAFQFSKIFRGSMPRTHNRLLFIKLRLLNNLYTTLQNTFFYYLFFIYFTKLHYLHNAHYNTQFTVHYLHPCNTFLLPVFYACHWIYRLWLINSQLEECYLKYVLKTLVNFGLNFWRNHLNLAEKSRAEICYVTFLAFW